MGVTKNSYFLNPLKTTYIFIKTVIFNMEMRSLIYLNSFDKDENI